MKWIYGDALIAIGYVTWHAPHLPMSVRPRACREERGRKTVSLQDCVVTVVVLVVVLRGDRQQHCTERMTSQGPRARKRQAEETTRFKISKHYSANGCTAKVPWWWRWWRKPADIEKDDLRLAALPRKGTRLFHATWIRGYNCSNVQGWQLLCCSRLVSQLTYHRPCRVNR